MEHVGPAGPQGVEADAAAVQGNGRHRHLVGTADCGDLLVARRLEAVTPGPAQELDEDVVEILRAGADQNLSRRDGHAPGPAQLPGDGAAQLRQAGAGQGLEQHLAVIQQDAAHQTRPDRGGKLPCRRFRSRHGRQSRRRGFRSREDRGDLLGKIAHLLPDRQIALSQELLIGRLYRDLADVQMLRQQPLGGQLLPAPDGPGEDVGLDGLVELLVEGPCASVLEVVGQHGRIRSPVELL